MYIAMNRFQVIRGKEDEFETIWKSRDKHLAEVSGFKEFHLLKGHQEENYTLYASHTVWSTYDSYRKYSKLYEKHKAYSFLPDDPLEDEIP